MFSAEFKVFFFKKKRFLQFFASVSKFFQRGSGRFSKGCQIVFKVVFSELFSEVCLVLFSWLFQCFKCFSMLFTGLSMFAMFS